MDKYKKSENKMEEINEIKNKAKLNMALCIIFLLFLFVILAYFLIKPRLNKYVENKVYEKKQEFLDKKKEEEYIKKSEDIIKKIDKLEGIKLKKIFEKFNVKDKAELRNKIKDKNVDLNEIKVEINNLNIKYGDNLNFPKFNKKDLGDEIRYSSDRNEHYINNHLLIKINKNLSLDEFKKELEKRRAEIVSGDEKENIYVIKFNRKLNEKLLLDNINILEKNKNIEKCIIIYLTKEEYENMKK